MKQKMTWFLAAISLVGIAIVPLLIAGCSTATPAQGGSGPASAAPAQATQTGGAELWGRNCGHCHNIRSPSSYSDAQWEVVMLHMRVRANLTGADARAIADFLKSR